MKIDETPEFKEIFLNSETLKSQLFCILFDLLWKSGRFDQLLRSQRKRGKGRNWNAIIKKIKSRKE